MSSKAGLLKEMRLAGVSGTAMIRTLFTAGDLKTKELAQSCLIDFLQTNKETKEIIAEYSVEEQAKISEQYGHLFI